MDQPLGGLDRAAPNRVACNDSGNLETNVALRVDELAQLAAKSNGSALDKAVAEVETTRREGEGVGECPHTSIDVDGDDFYEESKPLCRICHLSAKEVGKSVDELMELGCECRGELGFAHLHCAEAWFRVRGNQLCEICGMSVKNITGAVDNEFVSGWTDGSGNTGASTSIGGNRRCMHRKPACNFFMAFLVIVFVLPWFFHIDML